MVKRMTATIVAALALTGCAGSDDASSEATGLSERDKALAALAMAWEGTDPYTQHLVCGTWADPETRPEMRRDFIGNGLTAHDVTNFFDSVCGFR